MIMKILNEAEIAMTQPLAQSVRFKMNGRWYVQLGNSGHGEVCVMPADTDQDFALIEHLKTVWEKSLKPRPVIPINAEDEQIYRELTQ